MYLSTLGMKIAYHLIPFDMGFWKYQPSLLCHHPIPSCVSRSKVFTGYKLGAPAPKACLIFICIINLTSRL